MRKPHRKPETNRQPKPAAALVLELAKPIRLDGWCAQLETPGRAVVGYRLVPVVSVDFYPKPSRA